MTLQQPPGVYFINWFAPYDEQFAPYAQLLKSFYDVKVGWRAQMDRAISMKHALNENDPLGLELVVNPTSWVSSLLLIFCFIQTIKTHKFQQFFFFNDAIQNFFATTKSSHKIWVKLNFAFLIVVITSKSCKIHNRCCS